MTINKRNRGFVLFFRRKKNPTTTLNCGLFAVALTRPRQIDHARKRARVMEQVNVLAPPQIDTHTHTHTNKKKSAFW